MFRRRRRSDSDFEEEIRAHIQIEAERLKTSEGLSEADANAAARRAFGNVTRARETFYESSRSMLIDTLIRDLRYAFRMLRRSPWFSATAVLSLALGIGANTAIFSVIDAALLRYLPVRAPRELVTFTGAGSSSYFEYENVRGLSHAFQGVLASTGVEPRDIRAGDDASERVNLSVVSGNYFDILGVQPAAGRLLSERDDDSAAPPVAVISYAWWQKRFSRDPSVLGSNVHIGNGIFTVAGVAAKTFPGEVVGQPADVWVPLNTQPLAYPGRDWLRARNTHWLALIGRMQPGVAVAAAAARVTSLKHRLDIERAGPDVSPEFIRQTNRESIVLEPASHGLSRLRKTLTKPLWILFSVAGLVLLIACANVASLLLERAGARQKEIAVRLALGAGRATLMRQLLTESLLLSCAGGALGIGLSLAATRGMLQLASQDGNPVALQTGPDLRMLAFTLFMSLVTGIVFGMFPALAATRPQASALRNGTRQSTGRAGRGRAGQILVAAQVALSMVVLMLAALLLQTLRNLRHIDTGLTPEHLLVMDLDPRSAGYTKDTYAALCERVRSRFAALPAVNSVTYSADGLFTGRNSNSRVHPEAEPGWTGDGDYNTVGPAYFETLGIPIRAGRGFTDRDRSGSPPVTIVSEMLARYWFPGVNPIGRKLIDEKAAMVIVGVAADVRDHSLRGRLKRYFYVPYLQRTGSDLFSVRFMLRSAADPSRLTALVRQAVRAEDKTLPVIGVATATDLIDRTIMQERVIATLSGWFAAVALGLATVGLYGLMAYRVARRTAEIGIRMALGAHRGVVVRMVLGECLVLVLTGMAMGMPMAIGASQSLRSLLFGLTPADVPTVALSAAGVLAAGLIAGLLPARRASGIDPMKTLRYE